MALLHRPIATAVAALLLLPAAGALAARPSASAGAKKTAPAPAALFGFNDYSSTSGAVPFEVSADLAKNAGANTTRMTLWWEYVEYAEDRYSWGMFDSAYWRAIERGQRPLITVGSSPLWAQEPGLPCDDDNCSYPPAAEHEDQYQEFLQLVAQRYPGAAGIEIWNEPNLAGFFGGGPDPARYTHLLKLAHGAVKSARPEMPVVAGSLAGGIWSSTPRFMSIRDFVQGMYDHGAKGHMDAISVHAYPHDMDFSRAYHVIGHTKETRDANGDSVPLWITEYGVSTTGLEAVTEYQQAILLPALTRAFRADPEIRATYVHDLVESKWTDRDWGVIRPDLSPKPAYCALAAMQASGYTCPDTVAQAVAAPLREHHWEAQMLLGAASDAALKIHKAEGRFAGVTPEKLHAIDPRLSTSPAGNSFPGPTADPSRIGVFPTTDGTDGLLLCNVSRGERSYCVIKRWRGTWNYGSLADGLYATAGATAHGASTSW